MDLIITILPVVTKNLPISPRFTPYNFLSRCEFSTLTTRQPMVEFYLLTFPRFPLRKKEHKSYFGKNRTHNFRTSRGCTCHTLYTYTYGAHVQAHGRTYNKRIAQAAHAKHCIGCTPSRAHSRAIGEPLYKYKSRVHPHVHAPTYNRCIAQVPLRLPMPNIVQVQVQCARSRSRTPLQRAHRSSTSTV